MKKYFCYEIDNERCYSLDYFIEEMKENDYDKLLLYDANRVLRTEYFYCKAVGEICTKFPEGEPCGIECPDYEPKNKKNGCCKHRGYCYEPNEEIKFILKKDGKLYKNRDAKR